MLKEAKHPANLHGHRPEKVEINCFAKCLDRKGSDILKALAHQDEINGLSKGIFFSFILTNRLHTTQPFYSLISVVQGGKEI